ncbi:uncharacterized protein K489DRAFT_414226 [Dissoconium aciculare CBS 342.82]|uniref:Uncharacterized protein n=1 Tax=Dissoconium aciculare CBS 342.82 TaxID=1314786 RepID=A0A6J3LPN3_9PEZI|nr:uncharacterized protein K489DRAFT_414226 [Dissoconium aciculare CBS 342.82]KAF1817896.1 hypothetical protein K489DRAFT_414226 [Dissoconium aciculare CBS 342.82]
MQFTLLVAIFLGLTIAAPVPQLFPFPTNQQGDDDDVTSSDRNPFAGLLNGGQQSDSDGEANAVSTSECGLFACTSGSAASAVSDNSTAASSSSSSTDYTISILKIKSA